MTAAVLQIVGLAITIVAGLILSIEIIGGQNVLAWAADLQGIAFGIKKPKEHHHTTTGRIGIVITFVALGVTLYLLTEFGLWFHANVSANQHVNAGVNFVVGYALIMAILYGTLGVLTGLIRLLAYAVSLAIQRRAGVVGIALLVFGTLLQIVGTMMGTFSPAAVPPT